jgi:3-phenylpropionate/trans-cinnamate dioxygenase ferredoxin reductase subunit
VGASLAGAKAAEAARVVTAAMNVNIWDVTDDLRQLIESRAPIDPARLAAPDTRSPR